MVLQVRSLLIPYLFSLWFTLALDLIIAVFWSPGHRDCHNMDNYRIVHGQCIATQHVWAPCVLCLYLTRTLCCRCLYLL